MIFNNKEIKNRLAELEDRFKEIAICDECKCLVAKNSAQTVIEVRCWPEVISNNLFYCRKCEKPYDKIMTFYADYIEDGKVKTLKEPIIKYYKKMIEKYEEIDLSIQ